MVLVSVPLGSRTYDWSVMVMLGSGIVLAPYTYIATVVFGVPAFIAFQRFRLTGFLHYVLGGFIGPVIVFLCFGWLVGDASVFEWLRTGTFFGIITAPATALFWTIAVRRPRHAIR